MGASFLGQSNPALHHSMGQPVGSTGLQLVTAGGQLYLHQGGQLVQQVQPLLQTGMQQPVQGGLQGVADAGPQVIQQQGVQGVQLSSQLNPQQGGLGGWRMQ